MRRSITFFPHWRTESLSLGPMLLHGIATIRLIRAFYSLWLYAASTKSAGRV
jgi:hypothetical protein